jgi:hypothetical protein
MKIETRGRKKEFDGLLPTCSWSKEKIHFLDSVAKMKNWSRNQTMREAMERGLRLILEETINPIQ